MTRQRRNSPWLYWGYLTAAAGLLGWLNPAVSPVVIGLLAVVSCFYFFLQVPRPCRAPGRQGPCRNNAYGLLRGCHFRDHRLRNLGLLVRWSRWRDLLRSLWSSWSSIAACLAQTATVASGIVAVIAYVTANG